MSPTTKMRLRLDDPALLTLRLRGCPCPLPVGQKSAMGSRRRKKWLQMPSRCHGIYPMTVSAHQSLPPPTFLSPTGGGGGGFGAARGAMGPPSQRKAKEPLQMHSCMVPLAATPQSLLTGPLSGQSTMGGIREPESLLLTACMLSPPAIMLYTSQPDRIFVYEARTLP